MHTTRLLRQAIDEKQFKLYYQPQYDLSTGEVCGVEALIRWQRAQQLVAPGQFIPIAEESGLIVPLGNWVLNEACRQAREWLDQGMKFLRISVNLSGRQLRHPTLLDDIRNALAKHRLNPEVLELELTESWVMEAPDHTIQFMRELRELGIHLAIDDFGIAYSSLSYLKRFPVSRLKIDRSFVRDIPGDEDDAAIVNAVIAMAHSLEMGVVAEGVETEAQQSFLTRAGCETAQGFLYSRPIPAEELATLLGNSTLDASQ